MALLVKKYPVFEDNQVLTSSQLNNLVAYLDEQNRMTRVALIGVGIACGLEVSCETSTAGDSLTISRGVGVTSEGYLIKICESCVVTQVRTYSKPNSVKYPPFEDPITGLQDVNLYELLTEGAETDEGDDVAPFDKTTFDDYAILLYIECFDKDLKSCLGKSCDELGIDRFLNLRKLLISRSDLAKVLSRTEGGYQDIDYLDRFSLPQVVMPRPLFPSDSPISEHYVMYAANYIFQIGSIYNQLVRALKESFEVYKPALLPVYGENPFESMVFQNMQTEWIRYLTASDGSPLPLLGIQYFYNFIKDLILAYVEFRDQACDLLSLCCPDTDRFPKHLILGFLDEAAIGGTTSEARHTFTPTPIYGNQKGLMQHVMVLHQKIVLLMESFDLDRLRIPHELELQTKITPSCEKKSQLSDRSIPFYYHDKSTTHFSPDKNIMTAWRGTNKPRLGRQILSYDLHQPFDLPKDEVITPLEFDLDAYDFLRIEGHVGKKIEDVLSQIDTFKKNKNLEFDVVPIYLGLEGLELGYPDCLFSDLQPAYSVWRNKTLYFLKTLLALTTRLAGMYGKQEGLTKSFLKPFRSDSTADDNARAHDPKVRPIDVNPAKFSNLSDVQLNVNKDNWEYGGIQVIRAFDNLSIAEKEANDAESIALGALGENPTIRDYLDYFNDCLGLLLNSMKVDLMAFHLTEWKKHYSCTLNLHIEIMKRLALQATNRQASAQAFVMLSIYCAFYKAIRFLSIYPYLSIGTITDTLKFRKNEFLESLKFSNYLKNHPGLDHKAGVSPGGTFLPLYLSKEARNLDVDEFIEAFAGAGARIGEKDVVEVLQEEIERIEGALGEFEGLVVGDFSLQHSCCDVCTDMSNAALTLDPLGLPVCGVVIPIFKEEEEPDQPFLDKFRPLKMRMISHVYDLETYRTNIISDLRYGNVSFDLVNSSFEFHIVDGEKGDPKKVEMMTYKVNVAKIVAFHQENPNVGIAVDEFEYEIYDETRDDEVVSKNKVTIFIPIIPRDFEQELELAEVTGKVEGIRNREAIPNANVTVKNSRVSTVSTDDQGIFRLFDVPEGDHIMVFSHHQYRTKEVRVTISAPSTDLGVITLQNTSAPNSEINFGNLLKTMEIPVGSLEAIRIANNYATNTMKYKDDIDVIADASSGERQPILRTTADTIKELADSGDVNVIRLNSEFKKRRNEIAEIIATVPRAQRTQLQRAMELLTLTYLERLAVMQPKELTTATVKVLDETASLINASPVLRMKSVVDKWLRNARGNVSSEFERNLQDHLKLNR